MRPKSNLSLSYLHVRFLERGLTVGVIFLTDAVHSSVWVDAQEVASIFAVQPLGLFEVARWEAVGRSRGKSGDLSTRHLSLSLPLSRLFFLLFCSFALSSPLSNAGTPLCGLSATPPPNPALLSSSTRSLTPTFHPKRKRGIPVNSQVTVYTHLHRERERDKGNRLRQNDIKKRKQKREKS